MANFLPNSVAWPITIGAGVAIWYFYVFNKEPAEPRTSLWLWLIVGPPLLFAFLLRAPIPDSSFDVWSLRLFHGERALRGYLYWPGEFFPTAAPFNPTPDMITGIFRHAFGYRLGTIVNLLVLLWIATVVDKLLRSYLANDKLRAAAVLLVVGAEQVIFEINNYMPDLLALPLLLEATRLTLNSNTFEKRKVLHVALLLGLAVGLKLSNGAVAMPIVIVWLWRIFTTKPFRTKEVVLTGLFSSLLFFAPFFPFLVWVYRMTGNPIFPLYNKVFQSPLYPPFNGWDNRWGGYGIWEIVAWPLLMFFEPVRTSELPVYSGRLSLAFVVSLACLFFVRKLEGPIRTMVFVLLFGSWAWSLTMGYIRYGLYLELLSGILLIALVSHLWSNAARTHWRSIMAGSLTFIMVAQLTMAAVYVSRTEWSIRPTVFDDFKGYQRETKYLFTDQSIRTLLRPDDRNTLDEVDVWIVSGVKTSGLLPFLNERASCISVRFAGLLLAQANREALAKSLEQVQGKRLWSLAIKSDYNDSLFALRGAGLKVSKVREFDLPFFSPEDIVPTYLFQVVKDETTYSTPERTTAKGPLAENIIHATLEAPDAPRTFKHDRTLTLFVRTTNRSGVVWPSLGAEKGEHQLAITARWLKDNKPRMSGDVTLPYDLAPGESTILPLSLSAPSVAGKYTLQVDLVQGRVNSFADKPLVIEIIIEP
ncbi:MAG: hypothetical protein DMF69_02795 [Acidobacteria bacterium]|nr:MAG: hypothetical protein DMF69_02795 [Acidobacteriota bacterium]